MSYDLDKLAERRGTGSMKRDVPGGELPTQVAGMDFETAPEIREALIKRTSHGIFGYTVVSDAQRDAVAGWWERHYGFATEKDWLVFTTGVVPVISNAARKLTMVGENMLVQTPIYNIFFHSIRNNGRNVIESRLLYDGVDYRIDWKDLEKKLSGPQTTLMILCNPYNPTGMIRSREELGGIGEPRTANRVKVLIDETHCDLTEPGYSYIPSASVSEKCAQNSVTCLAPTKALNLAGLQTAAATVPNKELRHRMERALNTDEVAELNVFAIDTAIIAFTKGDSWLDALREHPAQNRETVRKFLEAEIPEVLPVPAHATYLLWPDCSGIIGDAPELCRYLRAETGLCLSVGMVYGGNGRAFLRMNTACPRERLLDGPERLRRGIKVYT